MLNDGNYIGSMSRVSRWLADRAEELGVTIVPETTAAKLLVSGGRVVGVRTGDRGRGRDGAELGNYEPGSDIVARATILADGTLGHLTRAAISEFRIEGDAPQVYALGVKEVWEVPQPLHRIIHTLGWPLRGGKESREFGGSFIYPMGEEMVALGLVVGMDYTDATLSVHDLLQELKLHPLVRDILEGGTRVAWGAKTIPEGGLQALPRKLHIPGALLTGDAAGFVNVPALKGVHYAMRSGMLAAETALDAVRARRHGLGARRARALRRSRPRQLHLQGPGQGSEHAPRVRQGPRAGIGDGRNRDGLVRQGSAQEPEGRSRRRKPCPGAGERPGVQRARRRPDVRQALERLPVRERHTRRRAGSHPGAEAGAARARGDVGTHVPGTGVRDRRGRGGGRDA